MQDPENRYTSDHIAQLLVQFDVTRLQDPPALQEYCDGLHRWIESGNGVQDSAEVDRIRADLWFMQGMLCHVRGDLDAAIDHLHHAIDRSKQIGYVRRRILSLRSVSLCYENAGMQTDATRYIFEALDLANELGDDHTIALVSHTLTSLYQAQGAHAQLFESALRTRDLAERTDDTLLLSRAYSGVGVALAYVGRADEGFAWLDRAAALVAGVSDPLTEIYFGINRVFLLQMAGRTDEAVALGHEQVPLLNQIPTADSSRIAVLLAQGLVSIGDFDQAAEMLKRADKIVQDGPMTAHLPGYFKTAAKVCEAKGDATGALDMMRRYITLVNDLGGQKAQARLVALERHFADELAAKTEEIHHLRTVELVEKNNQLSDLIQQKDEILHVVAHDLRNPLAAAQMLGEALMIDLSDRLDDELLSRLGSISAAAIEMRATVDKLVVTQRSDAVGTLSQMTETVQLAVTSARGKANGRDVEINMTIDPIDFIANSALLRRALDDLLRSAIESSKPGDSVDLAVRTAASGGVSITIGGDGVRFAEQFRDGRTLYIARRLIERMKGSIEVSSTLGTTCEIATIELRP